MLRTSRHKTNPFIADLVIPVGNKSVRITTLGKDSNILVNQVTGEVSGTHVVAHKRVDSEKFVKTFADYMAFTFDLTKAGNKALKVIMWQMKEHGIGKDNLPLDKIALEEFLDNHKHINPPMSLSYPTFTRGLAELEKAQIIAKTMRLSHYFINPNCIFNGDRIAFTTVIERQKKEEQLPLL